MPGAARKSPSSTKLWRGRNLREPIRSAGKSGSGSKARGARLWASAARCGHLLNADSSRRSRILVYVPARQTLKAGFNPVAQVVSAAGEELRVR